jgi:hypothetical protein
MCLFHFEQPTLLALAILASEAWASDRLLGDIALVSDTDAGPTAP